LSRKHWVSAEKPWDVEDDTESKVGEAKFQPSLPKFCLGQDLDPGKEREVYNPGLYLRTQVSSRVFTVQLP
jgi:hypothetical protein